MFHSSMSETATRTRTRQAILEAAVTVIARNHSASLADVAAEAGVGRTTLHRYFAERSDLIAALAVHSLERVAAATERAALSSGPAPEALARLCREYFELGDVLTLLFNEFTAESWEQEVEHDRALLALVERGHAEGTIDPALPAAWIQYTLWALLYSSASLMDQCAVPRHEALDLCVRSLTKVVAPVM
jgi:AcrR family transcriptional regulator